jgi:hypothetical protein
MLICFIFYYILYSYQMLEEKNKIYITKKKVEKVFIYNISSVERLRERYNKLKR